MKGNPDPETFTFFLLYNFRPHFPAWEICRRLIFQLLVVGSANFEAISDVFCNHDDEHEDHDDPDVVAGGGFQAILGQLCPCHCQTPVQQWDGKSESDCECFGLPSLWYKKQCHYFLHADDDDYNDGDVDGDVIYEGAAS